MRSKADAGWVATVATVTSCRYQFARLNTLSMGVQTGERFRIGFAYRVRGVVYAGEFESPVAIAQGETVSLRYNPENPRENSRASEAGAPGRGGLVAVGVAGSVVLSLAWLVLLRGCE